MTSAKRFLRLALATFLAAVLGVWLLSSGTLSSFKKAQLTNSTSSLKSALLAYQHSYGTQVAPQTCSGDQSSTSPVACSGSVYASNVGAGPTDTITNTGSVPTSRTTATAQLASCGAVQLVNTVNSSKSPNGPLLPRTGTVFNPNATSVPTGWSGTFGNITLAGTGYASSALASAEPTGAAGVVGSASYGLGIWFNTKAKAVPLFGFGSDPGAGTASNDRILYLDGTGRIAFVPTLTASPISSTTTFADGTWHYAYIAITVTSANVATALTVTYGVKIYVDGISVAGTTTNLLGALTSYSGYWHVGEAPIGGVARYFTGSLAGFTVDDSGSAPASMSSAPTSYGWDNSATALWPMNDTGATTYSGTAFGLATPVCGQLDIAWTATGASTTPRSMTNAIATGTTFTAPAPSATTTLIVTTSHDATYNAAIAGLIVYAPITITFTSGTAPWSVGFTWTTTPTSTFVVS